MIRLVAPSLLCLLAACVPELPPTDADTDSGGDTDTQDTDTGDTDTGEPPVDADEDGYPVGDDCDDTDPAVNPGAAEVCDGVDNDCDELTDPATAVDAPTWYFDYDYDGHGDPDRATLTQCSQPAGYAAVGDDCNDNDPDTYPGAPEPSCGDATDYNCDGSTGMDDGDGDGFGACEECDDTNPAVNGAADERCDGIDNNCDTVIDEDTAVDAPTWSADDDGDGLGDPSDTLRSCSQPTGYLADATDCDDTDPGLPAFWYADADGDGHGDPDTLSPDTSCVVPEGYAASVDDCDDTDGTVYLGAAEACDGVDHDCDTLVDEVDSVDVSTWYEDGDGDGYGAGTPTTQCDPPTTASVLVDGDCADTDPELNPAAADRCDGVDNDCDGAVDEDGAIYGTTWYADADGDTHGDPTTADTACSAPAADSVTDATDCDDTSAVSWDGAPELCDGVDNDCDGDTDEDADTYGYPLYQDNDGDGYGTTVSAMFCSDPLGGWVADDTDCDDTTISVLGAPTWYADADGDTQGSMTVSQLACSQPTGYVSDSSDCDDAQADVYLGAPEYCGGVDHDCDGFVDEDDSVDALTWYADEDDDGYGDPLSTTAACAVPLGYLPDDTDCDDADQDVNPGTWERNCNDIDDNCDDIVGTYQIDVDDYANVRTALAAAADGDTVCVPAGTYSENPTHNFGEPANVTLEGAGPELTILDGRGVAKVLDISYADNFTVRGLSLTDGSGYISGVDTSHGSGTTTLQDVWIYGNDGAPAVATYSNDLVMDHVRIFDNAGDSPFESDGGGVLLLRSTATLDHVVIADNALEAAEYCKGAGIFIQGGTASITNSVISGNSCSSDDGDAQTIGGGGYSLETAVVTITNSAILDNYLDPGTSTSLSGPGWYTESNNQEITAVNTVMAGNWATSSVSCGGWCGDSTAYWTIEYGDVYDNDGNDYIISDQTGKHGNLAVDPLFSDTTDALTENWVLSLSASSTLTDAGDPDVLDADGTVSDIGPWGGPAGRGW